MNTSHRTQKSGGGQWLRATRFLFLFVSTVALPVQSRAAPVSGTLGMVTTAHPLATQAGVEMLRQGGNAADAAAAAAFTLSVVEPYSSGIGGGGFALTRFGKDITFMDFREVAPENATRDMYVVDGKPDQLLSRDGPLSVAVPGAVAGYLAMQQNWGKLTRAQVLAPAIKWATEGFPVTARYRRYAEWRLDVLRQDPEASRIFLVQGAAGEEAQLPPLGHRIIQADNANTLQLIAELGPEGFYAGEVAKKIAADMKRRGGLITRKDLANYQVRERQPLIGSYRGHAVVSSPPPSSGGQLVLTILNMMELLPAETLRHTPKALHWYIESSKRAYADRWFLGDPDHVRYVNGLMPRLLSKERAGVLAKLIGERATPATEIIAGQAAHLPIDVPRQALPNIKGASSAALTEGSDTTHLSVVDAEGNAVSMTTTVNYGWGACIVARGTGVLLNDEMDDFAIAPGTPNAYEVVGSLANSVAPGKVPLSSMSPTLLFSGPTTDSAVELVLGSPGGSRIPTTVIQAIINHIDHGANIEVAIGLGRVHHQHLPDVVRYEKYAIEPATLDALRAMGHTFEQQKPWSNATGIAIDPSSGVRTAAADPRGIGTAEAQ